MGKRRLSKSDIKRLNERIAPLGLELDKKETVDSDNEFYLVDGKPWLYEEDGLLVPHLKLLLQKPGLLKTVTVDMGAVPFIVGGADVMRPGVTAIEGGISEDQLVAVIDERHGKPLAVGNALLDSADMETATSGKVVATRHWVGDKHWNA